MQEDVDMRTTTSCLFVYVTLRLLLCVDYARSLDPRRVLEVRSVGKYAYDRNVRRAVRLRRYEDVFPRKLFLTARNGGLVKFDISDPTKPVVVHNNNGSFSSEKGRGIHSVDASACYEGQDLSADGKYFAVASPCSAEVFVFDAEEDLEMPVASVALWPRFGALHVRWIVPNGTSVVSEETNETRYRLLVSNPGRRWDNIEDRWIDETPSEVQDGFVVLQFESTTASGQRTATLRRIGSVSPGNVNGTESLTVLHPLPLVLIGGFRSHHLDLVDISDPTGPRLVDSLVKGSYRQMVGAYHDGLAYLGMWGNPGGLAIFSIENAASPSPSIRAVSSILSDTLSGANRVKLATRSKLALLPLEISDGGAFAIVDIADVSNVTLACDVIHIPGANANETTYALELGASEAYIYVAPTDGTLRVYAIHFV